VGGIRAGRTAEHLLEACEASRRDGATNLDPFVTIRGWDARSRWLYGWHNNTHRINRLRSTMPHGLDPDGDPWYAAVLYPAPPDPVYQHDKLVGVVGWVGHLGCLWPNDGELLLPLVRALGRRSRYFVVPIFGIEPGTQHEPGLLTVLLPDAGEVHMLRDQLE
jgi:hypothetical protein